MDDRYKQVNPKFRGGVSSSRSIRAAQQVKDRKLQRFNSLQSRRSISESDVLSPATPFQQNESRKVQQLPTQTKNKKEAEEEAMKKLMQRLENYKKKKQRLQQAKKLRKKPIFYSGGGGVTRNPLVEAISARNTADPAAKSPIASTSKRQPPVWHSGFSSMSKKNNFTLAKENKPLKSNKNLFSTVQYRSHFDLCKPTEFPSISKQTEMPSQSEFCAPFGLKEITPIVDNSRRSTIRFSSPPPKSVSSPDDKPKKMPLIKTPRPSSGRISSKKSVHRVASNESNSSSSESYSVGDCETDSSKVTPERKEDREHFLKQMEQSVGRSSSKKRSKLSCSRIFSPGASLGEPGSPTSTRGGDTSTTELNCRSSPNVSRTNLSVKFVSPDILDTFNCSRKSSSFTKRKSTPHPLKSKSALSEPPLEMEDNSADEAIPMLRLSESPSSSEKKNKSLSKRESVDSGAQFTVMDKSPVVESGIKNSVKKMSRSSTPSQQFCSSPHTTGSRKKSLNDSKRSRKSLETSINSSYIKSTLEQSRIESLTKPTETIFSVTNSEKRVSLVKSTEKKPADAVFSVSLNESDVKSPESFSGTITAEDLAIMTPISTRKRKSRIQDLASSVPRRSARLSSIYDCSTPCSQRVEPVTPCSRTTRMSHAARADLTWLTENNTPSSKRKRRRKDTIGNVADSFANKPPTPRVVLTPSAIERQTGGETLVQENRNHLSVQKENNMGMVSSSPENVENLSNHQKKIKAPKWMKVMAKSLRDSSFVSPDAEDLPDSPSNLALSVPRVNKTKKKTLKRRSGVKRKNSEISADDRNLETGTMTHQSTMKRVKHLLGTLKTLNKSSAISDSSGKNSKRKKKRVIKVDLIDHDKHTLSLTDCADDQTEGADDLTEGADDLTEGADDRAEDADDQAEERADDQAEGAGDQIEGADDQTEGDDVQTEGDDQIECADHQTEGDDYQTEGDDQIECADHQIECDDHQTECADHQIECDDHQIECADHQIECDDHQIECDDHQTECDDHQIECDDHQIECDDHQIECDDHQTECADHQIECVDHQTECADHQTEEADQFTGFIKKFTNTIAGVKSKFFKGDVGLPDELLRPSALTFETTCTPDISVFSGNLSETNTPQSQKRRRLTKMSLGAFAPDSKIQLLNATSDVSKDLICLDSPLPGRVSQLASLYEEHTPSSGKKKRKGTPSSARKSMRLKKVQED